MTENTVNVQSDQLNDYIPQQVPGLIEFRVAKLHCNADRPETKVQEDLEIKSQSSTKCSLDEIKEPEHKRSRLQDNTASQSAVTIDFGQCADGAAVLENILLLTQQSLIALPKALDGYSKMKADLETLTKENIALRTEKQNLKAFQIVAAENEECKETILLQNNQCIKLKAEIEKLKIENEKLNASGKLRDDANKNANHACDNCGKTVEKIVYCSIDCLQSYM